MQEGGTSNLTFTIKNTNLGDLTGLSITTTGADAAMFSVTAFPTAPLSGPSGSTTFTVANSAMRPPRTDGEARYWQRQRGWCMMRAADGRRSQRHANGDATRSDGMISDPADALRFANGDAGETRI